MTAKFVILSLSKGPITAHRLPITDYRSPITDHRLPITDHRLPTTDYRLPTTDHLDSVITSPLKYNRIVPGSVLVFTVAFLVKIPAAAAL